RGAEVTERAPASGPALELASWPVWVVCIRYNLVFVSAPDFAMLIVLSPAKSLDYETPPRVKSHTLPRFIDRSATLIERLRKLAPQDVASLMDISDKLAVLNVTRYADW